MPSEYYKDKVKSIKDFDYSIDYRDKDLRKHPELYKVGRWEQGVLMVEPYKSEILPSWRFKTPDIAQKSAEIIYDMFLTYLTKEDFVWADMARKYLQMWYTRSRRYANHTSGKKYASNPQDATDIIQEKQLRKNIIKQEPDALSNEKAQSAKIFYKYYEKAKENKKYKEIKKEFIKKYNH